MSLNVTIPPKSAAVDAAIAAQARSSPADALVLHIYCDGSYKRGQYIKRTRPRGGIGIVANFWLPRDTTKQRTSKACFIPCYRDDTSTSTEAFALAEGAYVGLDKIESIQARSPIGPTDEIQVIFWSDSVTVLEALEDPARFRAQAKNLRHVLDIIKLKTYELQGLRENVSVQFRWCPEECVEPHALADDLSRQVRLSGGNTTSKALTLFKSGPYSSIKSALRSYVNDDSPSPEDSGSSNPYAFIEIAALELPVQHKDVILAAIELQKKVNLARTQNEAPGQSYESEGQAAESGGQMAKSEGHQKLDGQDGESADRAARDEGRTHELDGQISEYDGQVDEDYGHSRETEAQVHESDGHIDGNHGDADEYGSSEDGDADDELELVDQARPSRMHTMWTWIERRLPRM